MTKITLALAMLAGLAPLASAGAAEVRAQDPASVAVALQQAGYRAQLSTDDVGDPLIRSSSSGSDFLVFFYNCTDNTDCRTIQFYAGYSEPHTATLESINSWNATNRFGRGYLGDDRIARIEMDLDLDDGGLSQELFEDNVEYWVSVMSRFEEYVGY